MPGPLEILKSAVKAVPAVRYALGVAGTISVIAIIKSQGIDFWTAVFGAVVMFVLMTALVIFARLTSIAPSYLRKPALIFTWFSLVLMMSSALMLFTHVFFGFPSSLNIWHTETEATAPSIPGITTAAELEMEAPPSTTLGLILRKNLKIVSPMERGVSSSFEDEYGKIEVLEVIRGGPADRAGIRVGDIIRASSRRPILDIKDIRAIEDTHRTGDTVRISILRQGKEKSVTVTLADAKSFFQSGCQNGNDASCTEYGFLLFAGQGVTRDDVLGMQMFERACQHNYARGCAALAQALTVHKDYGRAAPIAESACSKDIAKACALLGYLYQNGFGVQKDTPHALVLLKKSCDDGNGWGCLQVGLALSVTLETREQAKRSFERGCDLGDLGACELGRPEEWRYDRGVPPIERDRPPREIPPRVP